MKILVFDNYDSFTYNIVHALRELGINPEVVRNDQVSLDEIDRFDKIILSPGPGIPEEAGLLMPLLKQYATKKPILGVCLGHQGIALNFGAQLLNLPEVFHGISSPVKISMNDYLFKGLPDIFEVGRYHSWVVDNERFPSEELEVIARDQNNLIMAIRHKTLDIRGVQFHPESILTPHGLTIIKNWIEQ